MEIAQSTIHHPGHELILFLPSELDGEMFCFLLYISYAQCWDTRKKRQQILLFLSFLFI